MGSVRHVGPEFLLAAFAFGDVVDRQDMVLNPPREMSLVDGSPSQVILVFWKPHLKKMRSTILQALQKANDTIKELEEKMSSVAGHF